MKSRPSTAGQSLWGEQKWIPSLLCLGVISDTCLSAASKRSRSCPLEPLRTFRLFPYLSVFSCTLKFFSYSLSPFTPYSHFLPIIFFAYIIFSIFSHTLGFFPYPTTSFCILNLFSYSLFPWSLISLFIYSLFSSVINLFLRYPSIT